MNKMQKENLMITSIVFSKRRLAQLDLLLNSLKQNFPQTNDIVVIHTGYDDLEKNGFQTLKDEHPDVCFIREGNFIRDLCNVLLSAFNNKVCFFTDDDIFYRKLEQVYEFQEGVDVFSLRLGMNTTKRQINNRIYQDVLPSEVYSVEPFITYNRMTIPCGGYWNYPLSVDGHVYRKEQISDICCEIYDMVQNKTKPHRIQPNIFEKYLQRFFFEVGAIVACPNISCVVNSPNNRVQDEFLNRSGDVYNISNTDLNKIYIDGGRINLNRLNLTYKEIECPHTEIDLMKGIV